MPALQKIIDIQKVARTTTGSPLSAGVSTISAVGSWGSILIA